LNKLIVGTEFADMLWRAFVKQLRAKSEHTAISTTQRRRGIMLYWKSLRPRAVANHRRAQKADGDSFGGVDQCKKELSKAAVAQFGQWLAWLVQEGEQPKIVKTPDAMTPFDRRLRSRF